MPSASVRKARLQDAANIFELVNSLSGDGTLLRRQYAEICENVRDFHVAESEGRDLSRLRSAAPIRTAPCRSPIHRNEARGQGPGRRVAA